MIADSSTAQAAAITANAVIVYPFTYYLLLDCQPLLD